MSIKLRIYTSSSTFPNPQRVCRFVHEKGDVERFEVNTPLDERFEHVHASGSAARLVTPSARPTATATAAWPNNRHEILTMNTTTFEAFHADAMAAGFDEVLERRWAPDTVIDTHVHAFGVEAVVTQGEMWLTCEGSTRHLTPGASFTLAPGVPHAERYGSEGATYWVARRCPR